MTPDELPADMEGLIENVALPWIESEEMSVDPEDLTKAGQAVRALLKAYQEQRRVLEAASPVVPVGVSVDALAQEIRRVDGRHTLGAGALAEALLPFLAALRPTDTGANHD